MKRELSWMALCFMLLFFSPRTWAQETIFADEASQKVYQDIFMADKEAFATDIQLVTDKAKRSFLTEYMALMNYTVANDKANYNAFIKASDQAFTDVSASPYEANLTCQLHIHKCMVELYGGGMISGGIQFWKSYKQFKKGEEKHPGYEGQLPFRGIYNVLLSQIPEKWKSLKGLLGLGNGDLQKGFEQIDSYRNKVKGKAGLYDEALIFSFANMFFSHDQNLTAELTSHVKQSQSPVVIYAYILSCGRRQMGSEATATLNKVPENTLNNFPLLLHQKSKYALRRGDLGNVITTSKRFLAVYKGTSNRNDAYLLMAYAYLLKDNKSEAKAMVDKCLSIKSDFDIDQRTRRDASLAMDADTSLLRARLLFEYGDFTQSLIKLGSFTPRTSDLPEYYFRLGRAEEKLGNTTAALAWYDKTIAISANSDRYFGPYSAIYAANIKLAHGDKDAATRYVNTAEKLNNGEFQKEMEQRIALIRRTIAKDSK